MRKDGAWRNGDIGTGTMATKLPRIEATSRGWVNSIGSAATGYALVAKAKTKPRVVELSGLERIAEKSK